MANENMIQKHEDNFLAKIAGETPIDDNPRNSTEFWLNEIAENLPGGGTEVIANPTLAGTEDPLTGLQVGDTKYSVGETKRYVHHIYITFSTGFAFFSFVNKDSSQYDTVAKLSSALYNNGTPLQVPKISATGYRGAGFIMAVYKETPTDFHILRDIYDPTANTHTYSNVLATASGISTIEDYPIEF